MIGFQIFQIISCSEFLAQKNISQKLMLPDNDKTDMRYCSAISIKFGGVNFKREWTNTTIPQPINRIFNFVFSPCPITQFQIVRFEFCIEPF